MNYKNLIAGHPAAAWLVLLLSLLVTSWAWYISEQAVTRNVEERFQFEAEDIITAINDRMNEYALVLRSSSGLFETSSDVSREDWNRFVDRLSLQEYFPGIQALGHSVMLEPDEVAAYEASIRAEGFTDYRVKPEGERSQYSAIKFISPFDWRNQRAFGYDMFSEPTRRDAMERARDSGQPAASGRVTLVQETGQNSQYGFLMYYPVYQQNRPLEYISDRRQALSSFVYAAFRVEDLMYGILGRAQKNIDFALYDSKDTHAENLLYQSEAEIETSTGELQAQRFSRTTQLQVAGRPWTLHIYSQPGFIPISQAHQPTFIVIVGLMLDAFLFYLISYLVRGRNQARDEALLADSDRLRTQQRLQLAAEAGGLGLAEWNIAENRLRWDDTMLALYGYKPEDFSGELSAWTNRLHPDDMDRAIEVVTRARNFSNHFDMEFRIVLPDDSIRYIAANVMIERDQADQAVRMVGFNRDVTDKRLAEQAVSEKNWRLQNVLEGTHVGTWEWNVDTGETTFNERWAEMIGYTLEELTPVSMETWNELVHPEDLEKSNAALARHFSGASEFYQCESRIRHKDGHWVWVLDRGKVFSRTDSGQPLMMFGTHQDISEQKQYEALLKQERDKAEMANRSRGEFLANMSHEIRTPINGVIGTLNLLADTELNPTQLNLINVSKRSADSLLGLINDILDLSKIESGKLKIHPAEFELLTLINDVARAQTGRAEAKGLALLCPDHYLEPVRVMADGLRIRQVLTNLLSNAIKFTEQGQITLDVQRLEETTSSIHFQFNVRDTGQGIEAEKQKNLFRRFEQLDNSLTRREGGSGLGLAISRQLVELMGGQIGVDSRPGEGSTFWFRLRLDRAEKKQPQSRNELFKGMRIYVVAADPLYQQFYQSVFAAWQVEYEFVVDYQQAIKRSQSSQDNHPVMVFDAKTLTANSGLAAAVTEYRQMRPALRLLAICPQSMLAIMPQQVNDLADLIVSKPIVQSELYNALLSVVEADLASDEPHEVSRARQTLLKFDARILVVEDNPTNVIIVQGLLNKFGIQAEVADNGSEALLRLEAEHFDLVLMDCQMPVMDGYEATRRLRQSSDIPVIALTAHAMREDEQKCLDAGMNGYLTKPIDPYSLNASLGQWLPAECIQQPVS
jgi:PAS domain S-box-containing protein